MILVTFFFLREFFATTERLRTLAKGFW